MVNVLSPWPGGFVPALHQCRHSCSLLIAGSPQLLPGCSSSSEPAFLHAHLLGWIGSVSVYKLHTGKKIQVLALLLRSTTFHEDRNAMKAAVSWKAFLFTARGGESLQRKSYQGLLGRATVILSPSAVLGFDSPTSVSWIQEVSATAICLLTMCLVEIQIASDFFPRLFHLLLVTALLSINSPTVETIPATLLGSGYVKDGWYVASGKPALSA